MKLNTKFNIDDIVYPIQLGGEEEFTPCETCNGKGRVTISNSERKIECPDCWGRGGNREWKPNKWYVRNESASRIGKVSFEKHRKTQSDKDRIIYMIDQTGIGSGTLWNENDLFISAIDAQIECDKRNNSNVKGEKPCCRTQGGKN